MNKITKKIFLAILLIVFIIPLMISCGGESLTGTSAAKLLLSQERLNKDVIDGTSNLFTNGSEAFERVVKETRKYNKKFAGRPNESYAEVEGEIKALMGQAEQLRNALLSMIDDDAACFTPLMDAYKLPKDNPERPAVIEAALCEACRAPMDIMRTICNALDVIVGFAEKGYAHAISDAGVGVVCCKAALQGASLNVFINTKSMKNRECAEALEAETQAMLEKYCPMADEIFDMVFKKIKA